METQEGIWKGVFQFLSWVHTVPETVAYNGFCSVSQLIWLHPEMPSNWFLCTVIYSYLTLGLKVRISTSLTVWTELKLNTASPLSPPFCLRRPCGRWSCTRSPWSCCRRSAAGPSPAAPPCWGRQRWWWQKTWSVLLQRSKENNTILEHVCLIINKRYTGSTFE